MLFRSTDWSRYGEVERNDESAVNILLDITRQAASGAKKEVRMDHWAIRVRGVRLERAK